MIPILARASFCLAIFILAFVGFFAVATNDPQPSTTVNNVGAKP